VIITISDVRAAGLCAKGAREWFEQHNFDFRDFLKNGIEAEKVLATGDGLARQVVNRKLEREGG